MGKRLASAGLVLVVVLVLGLSQGLGSEGVAGQADLELFAPGGPGSVQAVATGENLLVNGNMDTRDFYFRPTNHFVAGMWYEWFVTGSYRIPEFIDGGHPHHNACYPVQTSCSDQGNHSQGYILWSGFPFTAGIFQPAKVTPCVPYQFEAYARNDATNYTSKVGIDPTGEFSFPLLGPDPVYDNFNCPPDGHTQCPDPGVSGPGALPANIVWSPDTHIQALTWGKVSVVAEALTNTVVVWTYTAATTDISSQSAYWDAATLITATTYPGERLPAPISWVPAPAITNVTVVTGATAITLTWETTMPALTQVWYEISPAGTVTTSTPYSYTTYFPLVARNYKPYALSTPVDLSRLTDHQAVIANLQAGDKVKGVIAARYWAGSCVTEVSAPWEVVLPKP